MVVAEVMRVRNNTLRTFQLYPDDWFSTPCIDGQPCGEGPIEVPPGFDQPASGLRVPWEKMTQMGLTIVEKGGAPDQTVRCVVGPVDFDLLGRDRDWLRFHDNEWKPLAPQRWRPIGPRHVLGTIGGSEEIELTFRDARGRAEESAPIIELMHFEREVVSAPPNVVFLNVFDLMSALSVPNAVLCNSTVRMVGAFHAAVEVYGEEWSFYRTPRQETCGVCKSLRPRHHPVHVYRQSLNLGETTLKEWEVRYLVRTRLAPLWAGGSYDLLRRNCIHFCDELCLALGVEAVPSWIRALHETGASLSGACSPLAMLIPAAPEEEDDLEDDLEDATWSPSAPAR